MVMQDLLTEVATLLNTRAANTSAGYYGIAANKVTVDTTPVTFLTFTVEEA